MSIEDIFSETADEAIITLGDDNRTGRLLINFVDYADRVQRTAVLSFRAKTGVLTVGRPQVGVSGTVDLYSIKLEAKGAKLSAGGGGGRGDGHIELYNRKGHKTVDVSGKHGNLSLGGDGSDGDIKLFNADDQSSPTISLNADGAHGIFGGQAKNGLLDLHKADGVRTIRMRAEHGNIEVGGQGADGDISVRNAFNQETIRINGDAGDIIFQNADFAEEFDIADAYVAEGAEPGSVMVMNDKGALVPCTQAFDTRVVGVVAGAEGYKPALVLDRKGGVSRRPIAMIGKVMCRVCTDAGPIKIGDLLTTGEREGHAQAVTDRFGALGTVIGKAMGALDDGSGMIPVLVNLQ